MRYQFIHSVLLIIIFVSAVITPVNAQTIESKPELLYDSIRVIALDGRLTEAEVMARDLVENHSGYGDAVVLLARIIAWQERYPEAVEILDSLIILQPEHADARDARETIREWMDSAAGIQEYNTVLTGEGMEKSDIEAEGMESDTAFRGVDLYTGYSFDAFDKPYQRFWQIFSMGAIYPTAKGPLLGGVNFGNLRSDQLSGVSETGIQLQVEYWPKTGEKGYMWIAWAYSPFRYFPQHRISAEYWRNLSKGWVVSAGASYYYFDRNIFIPAFSVEKYLGKFWFSGKTYVHLKDAGTTASFFLKARRYLNDFDYLQLTAGAGTAPDEPFDIATDLDRQKAIAFKAAVNKGLGRQLSVKTGVGYSREEYTGSLKRNRFEGFVTLTYSPVGK
ncbi:MAG: YaiO family outer membrane beta-barrel protein [Bacteroidales bacterium]